MDKKSWDALNKNQREELLKKAGLPVGLSQLSWQGLQKSERKKLEKQGKGWREEATEVPTREGIKKIARRHHEVAVKKEAGTAFNKRMVKKKPVREEAQTTVGLDILKGAKPKKERKKKEPPLISEPQRKSYNPKFEETEAERMKEESRREEGTYEDAVLPFDTGNIEEMRQEAAIDEAYRKLPDDWFSAEKQKEWEKHEAESYGAESYEGNTAKSYKYYVKAYPLAMEWINKHHAKIADTKEFESTARNLYGDWKSFEGFLTEKQEELVRKDFEKQAKVQERKQALESKYFTTKFRDTDDHNKKECVEKTPVQKAHPFSYKGMEFFAHKMGNEWKVTEATTGIELARAHQFKGKWRNNSQEEIIKTAKAFIDEKTPERVSELIKYASETISRTAQCQEG